MHREARQQLQQDVVSPFPAHPLVTGLLAKVSPEQLSGGKATSRGSRHSIVGPGATPGRRHRHPTAKPHITD